MNQVMNPSKHRKTSSSAFRAALLAVAVVAAVPAYVRIKRVVESTITLNNVDTASVFGTKRKEG
ncbi:hypothetical protein ACSVHC_07100 [Arthrobacter sp. KNU-44]|uniref:hypothetical protein n=1 Tax=Arthrobacter sp. KNU-44 TaxID=3450744 RepID=UPI003F421F7A